MDDFRFWLESLDTQTLTDELKQEILEYAEGLFEDEFAKGYSAALKEVVYHIETRM